MFESDDWIFEDIFDDVDNDVDADGNEEMETKSHSSCQNEEKTPHVERRKAALAVEALPLSRSLTSSTFVQKSVSDTNIEDKDEDAPFKNDVTSRGESLSLGIFQKNNVPQETFDFAKDVKKRIRKGETQCFQQSESAVGATSKVFQYKEFGEKSHESNETKVRLDKEVKLIRIFPGPAGLILDVKNDDVAVSAAAAASNLSSVEESESETSTKRIEIKSQNEKNSCEEKAWKFLSNDLPNNFLQDYNISAVKDKANASHCDSTKIRFIAGALNYIDHSHDDPFVILKDSTGSIEGIIHRDIPSTYPGVLEPNVVILLCNVGLLKTTTYVVTNQYHILISLVNLLAIYSDKGRIVSTPLVESIISRTSNIELKNRINDRMPVSEKLTYISGLQKMTRSNYVSQQASNRSSSSSSIGSSEPAKNHELAKNPSLHLTEFGKYESRFEEASKNDKNCKVTDEVFERFNRSMDVFFTTDFTTLEERLNRSLSKSISQTRKIQWCDLRNTKHFSKERASREESTINFQKQTEGPQRRIIHDVDDVVKTRDTLYSRENCSRNDRDSNLSVKSTLPATKRRRNDVEKPLVNYFTTDESKYDSDDEILSQLDVDNVLFDKPKTERERETAAK